MHFRGCYGILEDSCQDGSCKDNCACKEKGCNDCTSKAMDEERPRRPLGARVSAALEACFPVAFCVTFFVTIVLFHCLL
ncbi:hypothetical protein MSG28_009316 [Choristoneura fumiferana]|uniref:Uncharacterized protein n=1 Tax=Choristoneura fumiferana TaxID=7141 RepID=A0ACC0KXL8_CHOFU|nr:hypothetical protein MSG28_009316 [Choristoneura fumiferana]